MKNKVIFLSLSALSFNQLCQGSVQSANPEGLYRPGSKPGDPYIDQTRKDQISKWIESAHFTDIYSHINQIRKGGIHEWIKNELNKKLHNDLVYRIHQIDGFK